MHATAAVYIGHHAALHADRQQAARVIRISLVQAGPAAAEPEFKSEPEPAPPPIPSPAPAPAPAPIHATRAEPDPPPRLKPKPSPGRDASGRSRCRHRPSNHSRQSNKHWKQHRLIEEHSAPPNARRCASRQAGPGPRVAGERTEILPAAAAGTYRQPQVLPAQREAPRHGRRDPGFLLPATGMAASRDLQVKGGSKVLRKAAKQAVQQALSLPPPPASMPLHEQIRFSMVYRLDMQVTMTTRRTGRDKTGKLHYLALPLIEGVTRQFRRGIVLPMARLLAESIWPCCRVEFIRPGVFHRHHSSKGGDRG